LQEDRPEIKAWTDLITLKAIPVNVAETERLKQYEEKPGDKREQKGIIVKPGYVERHPQNSNGQGGAEHNHHHHTQKKKKEELGVDESKVQLLKESSGNMAGKVHPSPEGLKASGSAGNPQLLQPNMMHNKHNTTTEYQETDEDREFLDMIDLIDIERTYLDNALEKLEETSFDAFNFC
jgi:hypothetical protein